ncbi:AraC family transcriptional regulator [Vibrio makurazakiensis]|uniref:helix-turn-helix transcriptional regulator n=1 Tax=Vibrio makurazakiensis TaxID=2910250 RepID=UPI003D14B4B9
MPAIKVTHFSAFSSRKRERYPATKNGIFVVTNGTLSFTKPSGLKALLTKGEFALYSTGDISNVKIEPGDGPFTALSIDFDLSIFQFYRNQFDDTDIPKAPDRYLKFDQNDTRICQIKNMILDLASEPEQNDFLLTHLSLSMLALMVKKHPPILSVIAKAAQLTVSQKVISYIDNNLEHNITLDTLAAHMGMSSATLKRRLASEQLSFSSLLKVKRLTYAATQLRITTHSITQIAYEAGFKSAAHFSTAFKNTHGMTPKDFRLNFIEV